MNHLQGILTTALIYCTNEDIAQSMRKVVCCDWRPDTPQSHSSFSTTTRFHPSVHKLLGPPTHPVDSSSGRSGVYSETTPQRTGNHGEEEEDTCHGEGLGIIEEVSSNLLESGEQSAGLSEPSGEPSIHNEPSVQFVVNHQHHDHESIRPESSTLFTIDTTDREETIREMSPERIRSTSITNYPPSDEQQPIEMV
eukprot:CAMPEP_0172473956 /NCGR_PEP_ID=MMETSP1065-20121228/69115_1 /TAXON_ID=265537 /ORGANISM="Amphiprora paludosa, Strain CCMP125" /LENGTH=194 /DNA_ID=CAMNT_0013232133 /DNA_START=464 /DNA_END=1048 /DNA_ORIENTATION=-